MGFLLFLGFPNFARLLSSGQDVRGRPSAGDALPDVSGLPEKLSKNIAKHSNNIAKYSKT